MARARKRVPPAWGSIQLRTTSRGLERFRVRYDVIGPNGERDQRSETVATWERGLQRLQEIHLEQLEGHHGALYRDMTVAEYLNEWLALLEGSEASPSTRGSYEQTIRLWIVPFIGNIRLDRLSAPDIRRALQRLQARQFAPSTVRHVRRVLATALNRAVDWRLIPDNPAKTVRLATAPPRTPTVWTAEQARTFLDATAHDPEGPLWRLLLDTGMRIGEALALAWDDVDLDAGTIAIRRTITRDAERRTVMGERAKTAGSGRRVLISPSTVAALRPLATEAHAGALVFPREDGSFQEPSMIRARFAVACHKAGLPPIRIHDLRHTNATLMLRSGVPVTVASKRLGHKHISMTLDVYAHVLDDMEDAAIEHVERLFGNGSRPARDHDLPE
jgi:integrase